MDDDTWQPVPPPEQSIDVPPLYEERQGGQQGLTSPATLNGVELSAILSNSPPVYPTSLPDTFPVGFMTTTPLVRVNQVEHHLRLLGALWQLREDVIAQDWGDLSVEARWAVYVTRAVCRFETWYLKVVNREGRRAGALRDTEIPPLDVAMIWHAYCLNPAIYLEDGLTRTKSLFMLGAFPLARVSAMIDPRSQRPLEPYEDRQRLFEACTGHPFYPPLVIGPSEVTTVRCPNCRIHVDVPWVGRDAQTGFGQSEFCAKCPSCELVFGKEALGVRRFCEHVKAWMNHPEGNFLAGTLLDPGTCLPSFKDALACNHRFLYYFESVCKTKEVAEIGRAVGWKIETVEYCCRTGMKMLQITLPPRFLKMLSHYRHPGPFSIDLVGATLRQNAFVQQMVDIGWTLPTRFAEDTAPLVRAIARYHAWLDLMSSDPIAFFVPTLDIDLVWHTAMLASDTYRSETHRLLSRIPDHEDKVEEGALSEGFDSTARAWKARFGVNYSNCGCAPPAEARPSKLDLLRGKNAQREVVTVRVDLVREEESDADATHPSEHNSILVINHPGTQKSRQERHASQQKRIDALKRAVPKSQPKKQEFGVHRGAFRAARPGNGSFSYLPYIVDGSSLIAGRCAVGIPGGICLTSGAKAFCGYTSAREPNFRSGASTGRWIG